MESILTFLLMSAGIALAVGLSYASMSFLISLIPPSHKDQ